MPSTMNKPLIRAEEPKDYTDITKVHKLAFCSAPHSEQTEHLIVLALREARALSLSFVAEQAGTIMGHTAFSPVEFSDGSCGWFGLGPVAVLPQFQRLGIGQAMIKNGLDTLQLLHASGCVVLGDPAYYSRFGFINRTDCLFADVPAQYFQVLAFGPHYAKGLVSYHKAFYTKN